MYYIDKQDYRGKLDGLGLSSLMKYIKELEYKADYNKIKVNTDLLAYESQLDEQRSLLQETIEALESLMSSIEDSKRLNRNNILEEISNTINNMSKNL